jgi:hypothetical protein
MTRLPSKERANRQFNAHSGESRKGRFRPLDWLGANPLTSQAIVVRTQTTKENHKAQIAVVTI